jgi:tRNA (guanine37-N1)-methyltransferase
MKKNLKFYLKDALTKKELEMMPNSFDVVGDVMIFASFPKELKKKEKKIAKIILENYRHIKVVAKKSKQYSGVFRLPKLTILGGEKRKTTIHKENGVVLHLDAEKVYFSPRSGTERQRVASLVRENESVLVMFSGCGPYVVEIAKHTKARMVYGVEINPVGHKYAQINAKANKVENKVKLLCGDVKKIVPNLRGKFDRILMPLPKTADRFLGTALHAAKENGTVHFYDFAQEAELDLTEQKVVDACRKERKKCSVLQVVQCGQYSPGHYRVCVDFKVKN